MFARKLHFKNLYSREDEHITQDPQKSDEALDDLLTLLEEQDPSDLIDTIDIETLLDEHIDKTTPVSQIPKFKWINSLPFQAIPI